LSDPIQANVREQEAIPIPGVRGEEPRPGRRRLADSPMLRAFAHRDYRLFFAGQWISLVGTWMQSVAQSWLVYRLTGSTVLLDAVGFSGQFPVLFLSLAGGSLADARSYGSGERRQRISIPAVRPS
jgi:hypothetical protein